MGGEGGEGEGWGEEESSERGGNEGRRLSGGGYERE